MKILVINTSVFKVEPPNGTVGYAGLEVIAWWCAKGLVEKNHQVSMVAAEGSTCPNVTIIPTGLAGQWDERSAFNAYKSKLSEFDVVIDHSWTKICWALKGKKELSIPVLGVMHAPINTMYQTLPDVDKLCPVCISYDQASHFQALFSREAKVCWNGIDFSFYKPLGIPRTDRFLFLARFSTIKGPHIAIEACKEAGVGLDLVGDTSITQEPEYLAKIKSMVDGKQIQFKGPANRGEAVFHFSQAHAFIHSAKSYREPFGLTLVESMACGCPVASFDNGACQEILPKTHLVKSQEDLVKLIKKYKNADYVDRTFIRNYVRKFSVENMVIRYEELCKEAVETGGW